MHRSGFVNILGKPNVGKSTLANLLVGEKLSIITRKAQTTRHRIFGIINSDNYQLILSDLPGILDPHYKLQSRMMDFVKDSLEDADVFIYMAEIKDKPETQPVEYEIIKSKAIPTLLLLNKNDTLDKVSINTQQELWAADFPSATTMAICAQSPKYKSAILQFLLDLIPESPPYFPKEELTDRPIRFFVTEIIREKIFLNYHEEIPYSTEVVVESYQDQPDIARISVIIYVERESQKPIVIGKNGEMLKRVGTQARMDIEEFLGKKVFLQTFVKISKDWRESDFHLKNFGYFSG